MNYQCPNGHTISAAEHETVRCENCGLIATWLNTRTGEVFTWQSERSYLRSCEALQDAMNDAFDNRYFDR